MLGFDVDILEEESVRYNCGCSKERMETALVSLGRDTLQEMIDDGKGAELACHFATISIRSIPKTLSNFKKGVRDNYQT